MYFQPVIWINLYNINFRETNFQLILLGTMFKYMSLETVAIPS